MDDEDTEELFFACEDGDAEWLLEILEEGVDNIDPTDEDGFTPLMLATNSGCKEVVNIMLKQKADPNFETPQGCSALLFAVQGGYVDCVKQMIKHKGNVNHRMKPGIPTPLYSASQEGYASITKILVEAKAEVDTKVNGVTPLFISSQRGHKDCVSVLLNAGANCNAGNKDHASPLFIAVQKNRTDVCKQLLGHSGIKVDNPTKDGTTPLLIAIQIGRLDEMELVIKAGADIERADKAGQTPLLTAATYGDLEAIEILVQNGVDLQKKSRDGRTAHVILKDEFGEDLLKIAAGNRRMKDLNALHKSQRPKRRAPRRDERHDLNERIYSKAANLFAQHDVDNDKTLAQKELREILVTMGCEEKLGAKKFDTLIKRSFSKFDKDNDGALNFEEFLRLYAMLMGHYKKSKRDTKKKQVAKNETNITTIKIEAIPLEESVGAYVGGTKLKRPVRPTRRVSVRDERHELNERIYSKAANLFAQHDVDNDKTLAQKELREILVTMGCEEKLGTEKFDTLIKRSFSKFDKDNDGALNFEEFLRLYAMLMGHVKKSKRGTKKEPTGAAPALPNAGKHHSKTGPTPPIHTGKHAGGPAASKRRRMSHALKIIEISESFAGRADLKLPSINSKPKIRW